MSAHLWEIDTPFYSGDNELQMENLAELFTMVRGYPDILNEIYGWSWWSRENNSLDEGESERFCLYVLFPRKSHWGTYTWWCHIERDQEPKVRELLDHIGDIKARRWKGERVND